MHKIHDHTYLENEDAKEHDIVVHQVAEALKARKHKPSDPGAHGDVRKLSGPGPAQARPGLQPDGDVRYQRPGRRRRRGLLDLLGYPYTGGGPGELASGRTRRWPSGLAYEKILYPDFAVFSNDHLETGGNLQMPLFVKPLRADASIGIGGVRWSTTPRR